MVPYHKGARIPRYLVSTKNHFSDFVRSSCVANVRPPPARTSHCVISNDFLSNFKNPHPVCGVRLLGSPLDGDTAAKLKGAFRSGNKATHWGVIIFVLLSQPIIREL